MLQKYFLTQKFSPKNPLKLSLCIVFSFKGANSTQDGDTLQSGGAAATPLAVVLSSAMVPTLVQGISTDGPVDKGSADVLAGAATTDLLPLKEVMVSVGISHHRWDPMSRCRQQLYQVKRLNLLGFNQE